MSSASRPSAEAIAPTDGGGPARRSGRRGSSKSPPAPVLAAPDEADDVAHLLLDDEAQVPGGEDVRRAQMRDEAGGADRRMAGERQLATGREDADSGRMGRVAGLEHEHGLGQVELARDGLHSRVVEPLRIDDHGERVARERRLVKTSSVWKRRATISL